MSVEGQIDGPQPAMTEAQQGLNNFWPKVTEEIRQLTQVWFGSFFELLRYFCRFVCVELFTIVIMYIIYVMIFFDLYSFQYFFNFCLNIYHLDIKSVVNLSITSSVLIYSPSIRQHLSSSLEFFCKNLGCEYIQM